MPQAHKVHLGDSLNRAGHGKALDAIQQTGRSLPCTIKKVEGAIVTVDFAVESGFTLMPVKMTIANSLYGREPTQVGDKGFATPADAHLGGVSGLGGGTAGLEQPANLAALVFHPVGNSGWDPPIDANAHQLQGPNGVILRDLGDRCRLTQTPTGVEIKVGGAVVCTITATSAVFHFGGKTTTIDASGVTTDGDVFAPPVHLKLHTHDDPQGGSVSASMGP